MSVKIVRIKDATDRSLGGKATGLAKLMNSGLRVPDGFVISGDFTDEDSGEVIDLWKELGSPKVAVRSSASFEDSIDSSAAGQLDSFLDVETEDELISAVKKCFASFDSERAKTYRKHLPHVSSEDISDTQGAGDEPVNVMSVVVQNMVESDISGVVFTVDPTDPVNGHNKTVIEACEGKGENLVSGHVQAKRYVLSSLGIKNDILDALDMDVSLIDDAQINQIVKEAKFAGNLLESPVDMEWSIDKEGNFYWLQMRPVTSVHGTALINEFDYQLSFKDQLFTRANVGEMLPGAATPLTINVFGEALNYALHDLYGKSGAVSKDKKNERFVCPFSSHLFMNLSMVYEIVGRVSGTSFEALEVSLLGQKLAKHPDVEFLNPVNRFVNFLKYAGYVLTHKQAIKKMDKLLDKFKDIPVAINSSTVIENYESILAFLPVYNLITALHMQVSAWSGALHGAIRAMLDKAGLPDGLQMDYMGRLLSHIDGIESAEIIKDLEEIAVEISKVSKDVSLDSDTLLDWLLKNRDSEKTAILFKEFIDKNGHRCVREAELGETQWKDDLPELAFSLWNMASFENRIVREEQKSYTDTLEELFKEFPKLSRGGVKYFVKNARSAIKKREYTKSILIKFTSFLRDGFKLIAAQLENDGLLKSRELIFFLTLEDIKNIINGDKEVIDKLNKKAASRSELYKIQMDLRFPDFCKGVPMAIDIKEGTRIAQDGEIMGLAVSPGIVKGNIRVVTTKDDAKKILPGEIICARFTDVGWTPYYGIAGGLITEIGSSLSHGAVVAREYRLPLVSSITDATTIFKTGDHVELNGTTGTIKLLKSA
ncbi:MAG: hypothetical protein JXR91_00905 [Deltaproteobacteria bacterium]|nr:hypothetical protein [Deltaproteobacteria bacterium]